MSAVPDPQRRNRAERRLLTACLLVIAGLLLWGRLDIRDAIEQQEGARLAAQVSAVELNLARELESVSAALLNVRDDLASWTEDDRRQRATVRLQALGEVVAGLRVLQWIDADGRVVASNDAQRVGTSVAATGTFARLSARPERDRLIVSPPALGPDGSYSVDLAVPLHDASGRFDGIVAATLDADYLGVVLGSVIYASDMRAGLIHGEGRFVVVSPPDERIRGLDLARPDTPFSRHLARGAATSVMKGSALPGDGQRLIAQHTLSSRGLALDRPLVLSISRSMPAVLQSWRAQSTTDALVYLVLGGCAWLALMVAQRRRAEAERLAQQRQMQQEADAERLELALRGADLALWDAHLPSGRATVNDRWFTMLGYRPGEVAHDDGAWESMVHPDDLDRVLSAQRAHLDGRSDHFDISYRLRHRDGHWVWVLDRGRVVDRAADGTPLRMVGTHMDISDRVAAEETLRRSEESLSITLHSIGDAVVATDPEGRVTRMNGAAERLTGWLRADALGRPLPEVFRIVDATTREPLVDPVARALGGGEVVGLANGALLLARDGHEYQVADSAAPIRHDGGQILGAVLVFSDVTEHYRMVQALRDREAQLAAIADALPGPVWRVDRERRFVFANAAYERWFGVPAALLLGRRRGEVHPGGQFTSLRPEVELALAGETFNGDRELVTAQGLRHAMITVVPDRDVAGAVQGAFVVVNDITERQRAEEALRLSEQRSRSLLNSLMSGVVLIDIQGRLLDANPAAARIFGRTLEQLRGHHAGDGAWEFLEEDGRPMPPERYPGRQVIASGSTLRHLVVGIRRPDLADPLWTYCSAMPLAGADGELQEVLLTFSDFTERKLALEQLRTSESRLRMTGRLARLGAWHFDVVHERLWLAPEMAAIFDAEPAEALSPAHLLRRLPGADLERWRDRVRGVAAGAPAFDDEVSVVSALGRTLHLRVLGEPVADAGGRVVAVQGAVQDVTQARLEQQQLRLLESGVARLNDVVLITEAEPLKPPGPALVFVNAAFERLSGWRRSEVLGHPPAFLQGPLTDRRALARMAAALARGRSVRTELINYSRGGNPYWVEVEVAPVAAPDGHVSHFVAVQRDIGGRKRAEAEVQAARDELAATLQAVPDLLFDADLEGRIYSLHAPRNAPSDVATDDHPGRTVADRLPPEAAAVVMQAIAEAHARGHSSGHQYRLQRPQGTQWFELSVASKPAPAGGLPRFIALARDITERKQAETGRQALEHQLREAQKMESIGTLAGGIAHDFNNILAAILGNVALARGDLPQAHAALASLDQIDKAGLRARTLVQQILTFSRRQPNELRAQPLRPVVEETLSLLRATLPASVRVDTVLPDEALPVEADATQLQQVVMNLCTNAWHALPLGRGRIEVGLAALDADATERLQLPELAPGPSVQLWVADNGIGMDAETRERMFDPFFTTKPVGHGTGLGLSVVHGIVRGHHGAIAVDSAPGAGSTFHVYLPLARGVRAGPGDARAPSELAARAGSGRRLLYVDDDEVVVLMAQRLLERAGWRVTASTEPAKALALATAHPGRFDIIVTDYNMPEMSGLELALQLARLRPAPPVVITSGYISDELREQAEKAGVRALLRKENILDELPALLQRLVAAGS